MEPRTQINLDRIEKAILQRQKRLQHIEVIREKVKNHIVYFEDDDGQKKGMVDRMIGTDFVKVIHSGGQDKILGVSDVSTNPEEFNPLSDFIDFIIDEIIDALVTKTEKPKRKKFFRLIGDFFKSFYSRYLKK